MLIQEAKRFQQLAGIITENNSPAEEKAKDQIEKTIDSPQSQAIISKMASELSDEEKQKILNFVSSVNESIDSITEKVDLDKVIDKLIPMTEENTLEEEENNLNTPKNILKQFIFGAPVLAMGLGIAKGMALGGGTAALAAVGPQYFGAAAAGAILIALYKAIKAMTGKEKSTKSPAKSSGINVLQENAEYKIQLLIDGKAVMEITADENPTPEELRDALTALETQHRNKFDFDKAELVVLDSKGNKIGSVSKKDTFLAQKTTKTGDTYSLGGTWF
jgi:hypothetical protein